MKVIQNDNVYRVLSGGSISMYDTLPIGTYIVKFEQMVGTFLEACKGYSIDEKIYGNQPAKVDKILLTFGKQDRNLGVLLSGDKGMGKSIMMKLSAIEAQKLGYPVIIVNENVAGLVELIQKLDQPVVVLFDEYDKVFREYDIEGDECSQNALLTLFDGTLSSAKKLFIMSCNDVYRVSEYMINQPGRIHYHIRFKPPTEEEIAEYCNDNIEDEYKSIMPKIQELSNRTALSYDMLRAICFEVNNLQETDLSEIVKDLNIKAFGQGTCLLTLNINKQTFVAQVEEDTVYGSSTSTIWLNEWIDEGIDDGLNDTMIRIRIKPGDLTYNRNEKVMTMSGNKIKVVSVSCEDKNKKDAIVSNVNNCVLTVKSIRDGYDPYVVTV
jgi:hypothetical protein